MIRMVLERLALFALPFALFAAYVGLARRPAGLLRVDARWIWLAASGLVLVILSFVYAGLWGGVSTSGLYVPPAYVHGHIVPAHIADGRKK